MGLLLRLVLVLAAIGGHVALMRSLINWGYRVKMHERVWNVLFVALFATMCVVPVLMVKRTWVGPVGGLSLAYFITCALYLVGAVLVEMRWRRPARALASNHTQKFDLRQLRGVAARDGQPPESWLGGIGWNEIYRLEVAERRLRLRSLPGEWEGLRILHLSDMHFNGTPNLAYFRRVFEITAELRPDLIALTGDILDKHGLADWLPETIGKLEAPLGRFFILGNHDAYDHPEEIRRAVKGLGWVDVGEKYAAVEHLGRKMVIAGDESPWLGSHPNLDGAPEGAFRVLMSHAPYSFRWAVGKGFDLVLAGHLHGGQIRLPGVGPVIGGRYAEGVFERRGTVMHVTRGVGVQAPVRYRCAPEVAVVVLGRG